MAKVTVQNIADALGLSRTTVSKVLNNAPGMSEKTVSLVIEKAKEMQYKHYKNMTTNAYSSELITPSKPTGNVALLAHVIPNNFHMASALMLSLEHELGKSGYSLSLHIVSDANIANISLPNSFYIDNTDAIVCLELFDKDYSTMLCSLGKPVLFSDVYSSFKQGDLNADILMVDNRNSVYRMLNEIIRTNKISTIGFVGDNLHCLSFLERYNGFIDIVNEYNFPEFKSHSVIDRDILFTDDNWLYNQLSAIQIPDLLFCSNDINATRVVNCLSRMGLSAPKNVLVCGFDGTPALSSINPTLTTVIIPSDEMGVLTAAIVVKRLHSSKLPKCVFSLSTKIHFNNSTNSSNAIV